MELVCQWFASLPACLQDMELASPFPEEPVSQSDADVLLEPVPVHGAVDERGLALHSYERPLAASLSQNIFRIGKIHTSCPHR